MRPIATSIKAERQLLNAHQLYKHKEFELATQQNLDLLEMFPQSTWADKALYNLGLIYSTPENPAKNYTTALEYFAMVYNNNPEGSLGIESRSWISVLVILQAQEIELDRLRETNYNYDQQVSQLKKVVRERENLINAITKKIEQYKQIDIELEEKGRVWKK
jgi:tetratricopeptide (TPR) repeat protein